MALTFLNNATFSGLVTATKTQNATSIFTFQNLDTTGTAVRTHLFATAGNRSIRLEAIHSDYSYVVSNNTRMYFQTNDGSNNPLLLDGNNATFTGLVSGITPVAAANFVTKAYVDGSGGGTGPFLPLAGGTMAGTINMGDNDVSGIDELLWSSGTKIGDDGAGLLKLTSAAATESGLRFDDSDGQLQGYVYSDGGATSSFGLLDGTGSWAVRCLENEYVELRYDNANKLRTTTEGITVTGEGIFTGDVGIGTTDPSARLQVDKGSSGNVAGFKSNATAINEYAGITLHTQTISGVDWYGSEIRSINTVGTPGSLNPRLGFFTQDNNTYLPADRTEKMSILGNGNVGIGTTNPNRKLVVAEAGNGNIALFTNTTDADLSINLTSGVTLLTPSTTLLAFGTSGSEKMRIIGNGNVGIDVTSPTAKLQVEKTDSGEGLRIDGAGNGFALLVNGGTSYKTSIKNASIGNGYGGNTAPANGLIVEGNVGIGTTNPSFKLHVDSDVASSDVCFIHHDNASQSSGTVMRIRSDAGNNAGSALLNVENNSGAALYVRGDRNVGIGTTSPTRLLQLTAGEVFMRFNPTTVAGDYRFQAADGKFYVTPEDTGVPTMTYSSGNVGIGTTSPDTSLTIKTGSSAGLAKISSDGNGAAYSANGDVQFYTNDSAYAINFFSANKVTTLMRITDGGNVGIGNTVPAGKLDVFRTVTTFAASRAETLSRAGLIIKSSGNFDSKISFSSGASSVQYIQATNNSATVGRDININPYGGNVITAGTMTATNFILSSDERLKENIEEVCDNRIKADWKTFELKTERGQKRYGVIAQELEKTNPEFVREDSQGFKAVAYIDLLIAKIAELEARLEKAGI